jgi:hypothetical protein
MPRGNDRENSQQVVHIRCSIKGEPAELLRELKERGVVSSVREAVVHGILAFYERTIERDLKRAQAGANLPTRASPPVLSRDKTRQAIV